MPVDSQLFPARAVISTANLEHNLHTIRNRINGEKIMAVIKADAYGHGLWRCARTFSQAGADYLGVAQIAEAIELARRAQQEKTQLPPIFSWMYSPYTDIREALELGLEISVGMPWASQKLEETCREMRAENPAYRPPRIHIAVDTGMSREGFSLHELAEYAPRLAAWEGEGLIHIQGVWSHLACADSPNPEATHAQKTMFDTAIGILAQHNIHPPLPHLAASAGTLWYPETRYAMVRCGIALYGYSPENTRESAEHIGLRPAMRLESTIMLTRRLEAGTSISYGHTFTADKPMRVGVVPLGYADGIPRNASSACQVSVEGHIVPILGRICMDQFIIELPEEADAGSTVTVWGETAHGHVDAQHWAERTGTIPYEITTRLASRVPRIEEAQTGVK